MTDKKVLNLDDFRRRRDELKDIEQYIESGDESIFESVIDDATRELIENAVCIANDLDIDITHDSFAIYMSTAAGFFKKALRVGFDLDQWEYKDGQEGDLVKAVLDELNKDTDE
ncbi:hypothetical protein N9H30_00195 [bacterium]|nr:hypothetical protein [bacterium]|tara:strand:- start:1087 stop:1428 length:342 start_codon:yes stop_codon:yes gene_type:complete